jgi:HAE1 family hydrophobic/amphiphilic exporter-1/multidrug efflux pump
VTAQSLLTTPADFEQIVLRAETDGGLVLLQDVARVEIGAETYGTISRFNGQPAAGMAIRLASGANALDTAERVKARMDELARFFPEGVVYTVPYDTTPFIEISIKEVVKTLFEAIGLVMLLLLGNLRATLIPTLAVPMVLLGTFGVLAASGFSTNTLTMLAMVPAIGLLVDDAIVVVENVERIMQEEGLDPCAATKKSMTQITGALVGIALVLSAVFVPMAFFGGSTGVIYRQFSIAIVSAMILSVVVAVVPTPALCASFLPQGDGHAVRGPLRWFERGFARLTGGYARSAGRLVRRPLRVGLIHLVLVGGMGWLFNRTPSDFLPGEAQGIMVTLVQAPSGATAERTRDVMEKIARHFLETEQDTVSSLFTVVGFSFAGQGQNVGIGFIQLKDRDERTEPGRSVQAVAGRPSARFRRSRTRRSFRWCRRR